MAGLAAEVRAAGLHANLLGLCSPETLLNNGDIVGSRLLEVLFYL